MLQQEDDSRNGQLPCERTQEIRVDCWLLDVLQASGDGLEDLDRVRALCGPPVAGVQPCRDGHDEDHEGITEDADEEEYTRCKGLQLTRQQKR
jgi:hypothetical protein